MRFPNLQARAAARHTQNPQFPARHLYNTFYYGIGEVWLLPTRSIYDKYVKINCCLEEFNE